MSEPTSDDFPARISASAFTCSVLGLTAPSAMGQYIREDLLQVLADGEGVKQLDWG